MATVLIVDDDRQFRVMLGRLLSSRGHTIQECADGEEIGPILDHGPVDLVFLDMVMEKKGGLESLLDLWRDHPRIPVILMSGNCIEEIKDQVHAAGHIGSAGYLQKPFSTEALYNAVDGVLHGAG